jgi:hypothetical protein
MARPHTGGHSGGPNIRVVGITRYQEMSRQLHRHRKAIFEDCTLHPSVRQRLVSALDVLAAELQALLDKSA